MYSIAFGDVQELLKEWHNSTTLNTSNKAKPVLEVFAETEKAWLLKDLNGKFWIPKKFMLYTKAGLIVPDFFYKNYLIEIIPNKINEDDINI